MVSATPGRFNPPERDSVPIVQEAGWAPGQKDRQCTYKHNNEARSRNHCCCGHAINIAYYGCVSILTLVIRHVNRIFSATYCKVICGLSIYSNIIIIFNYALQPLRLIVRSGINVPTFATRRLDACHHARSPSGGRFNCGREMSCNFA